MTLLDLSNQELDILLLGVLASGRVSNSLFLKEVFQTMYDEGLRYQESADISRWTKNIDGDYEVQTLKKGNIRIIEASNVSPIRSAAVAVAAWKVNQVSYSTAERIFQNSIQAYKIWHEDKVIGTHLFRHNRFKQWGEDGRSEGWILNHTGLKNINVVQHYLTSELKKEIFDYF